MKNVLITGATGGIGSALLNIFYTKGYNLFISGTNKDKLLSLKEKYTERLDFADCDLSSNSDIEKLINSAEKYFGNIDILINNAGIAKDNLFLRISENDWNQVININLNANFLITKLIVYYQCYC